MLTTGKSEMEGGTNLSSIKRDHPDNCVGMKGEYSQEKERGPLKEGGISGAIYDFINVRLFSHNVQRPFVRFDPTISQLVRECMKGNMIPSRGFRAETTIRSMVRPL